MKSIILCLFLFLNICGVSNAQSFPNSWLLGEYSGEETGMNAAGTRSYSTWAKIELSCVEGGCYATYSDGENSDTYNKFVLTPKGDKTTLSFYYSNCIPIEYGSSEPCTDPYKKNDFMFKLTKLKDKKGKPVILTTWGKIKKGTNGKVYFKKS